MIHEVRKFCDSLAVIMRDFAFSGTGLESHWDKHKSEIPFNTKEDYFKYADLESSKASDGINIIAYKRPNGDTIKLNKSTGWFFAIQGNRLKTAIPFRGGEKRFKRKMLEENGKIIAWKNFDKV